MIKLKYLMLIRIYNYGKPTTCVYMCDSYHVANADVED